MEKVYTASLLSNQLKTSKAIQTLRLNFYYWKIKGLKSRLFGKDISYARPKLVVGHLMHVHLIPVNELELQDWDNNWENEKNNPNYRKEKTSDRALVYVQNKNDEFLLISLFENAHKDAEDSSKMEIIKEIAEAFIIYGDVI